MILPRPLASVSSLLVLLQFGFHPPAVRAFFFSSGGGCSCPTVVCPAPQSCGGSCDGGGAGCATGCGGGGGGIGCGAGCAGGGSAGCATGCGGGGGGGGGDCSTGCAGTSGGGCATGCAGNGGGGCAGGCGAGSAGCGNEIACGTGGGSSGTDCCGGGSGGCAGCSSSTNCGPSSSNCASGGGSGDCSCAPPPQMSAVFTTAPTAGTEHRRILITAPGAPITTTTTAAPDHSRLKDARIIAPPPVAASQSVGQLIWLIVIVLVGVFFSAATSIGNALVMLSICVDKKLQTISNYFLFSLAVADLIIGIISIPLMTLYTAAQSWDFGYALCQFWLCIDYMMCNASVMNLLLISFDRYFSVTRPLTYRPKRTTRKALFMIACSYLLSLLLWPPWIVLWPYLEGRFIVEESALCVVQFLAMGNSRNLLNQLVTVGTAAAAFYIPVTLMIVLYYKVYLETQRRQKELRKLQDGQIRGLQSTQPPPSGAGPPDLLPPLPSPLSSLRQTQLTQAKLSASAGAPPQSKSSLNNFFELVNSLQSSNNMHNNSGTVKKKERFSLLKFCTGRSQTTADISSLDSLADDAGGGAGAGEDTSCGGGALTTSNLDSILADSTPIEMAKDPDGEEEDDDEEYEDAEDMGMLHNNSTLDALNRTSRPPSVHTYNSIVVIEYPDCTRAGSQQHQRPSVRLSSHAEIASLSARNSVERRSPQAEMKRRRPNSEERRKPPPPGAMPEKALKAALTAPEKPQLAKARSCPEAAKTTANGTSAVAGQQLMRKSDIMLLREENMRRSEKERRRNERKQEGKAAKTLSAILCAFILTWTPYNVIVCLEAFYPNSVPSYLFTLSYFLSYINSTINPLCYALCNARFRMTYLRIIRCKWRRHGSPNSNRRQQNIAAAFAADNSFGRTSSGRRVLLKRHSRARAAANAMTASGHPRIEPMM